MGKLNKLDDNTKQTIINSYMRGDSLKVIASAHGCTSPTVATFLKGEGITVRGKGKRKKEKSGDVTTEGTPTVFAGGCVEPVEDNSGLKCIEDENLKAVPLDASVYSEV